MDAARSHAGATPVRTLSTLRKTELQAMAREFDAPGRPTMTRVELEAAVAKPKGTFVRIASRVLTQRDHRGVG